MPSLFDGAFRVSEALGLTPGSLTNTANDWVTQIRGKGVQPLWANVGLQ